MKSAKKRDSILSKRGIFSNKKIITVGLMLLMIILPTFASGDTIEQLDTWGEKILSLFQSNWVKAILLVALIVEAIGMVVAGQQGGGGQILKKFAPWIIGTIILLSASGICSYFLSDLNFEISMADQDFSTEPVLVVGNA